MTEILMWRDFYLYRRNPHQDTGLLQFYEPLSDAGVCRICAFADYAAPRISYVLKAMDLTVLTGYEHEAWNLGDTVMVVDEDLDLSIKTRIVRRGIQPAGTPEHGIGAFHNAP